MDEARRQIAGSKHWVVKIGSSLITDDGRGLDLAAIQDWAAQLVKLQQQGKQTVLVSSGAVAEGVSRLQLPGRPTEVHVQQAAAAVGQMGLVQAYENCFKQHGTHAAQVLLTHADLSDRTGYLNARSTLNTLLGMNVVPVVNENDTVATAELCFGDNDTLAALVANLVNADLMVVLTDQDGLFSTDPRADASAQLIGTASANDRSLQSAAGKGSSLGRGGMMTKLSAARLAARSGTNTIIANGRLPDVLTRIAAGDDIGTLLQADSEPIAARKQWLAGQLAVKGRLQLDAGAVQVLTHSGRSLLAVGIKSSSGNYARGELVACEDEQGNEIARGLVNYNSDEVNRLAGKSSDQFVELIGYISDEEIIHRDNLILAD